jgi:hypothetical protein
MVPPEAAAIFPLHNIKLFSAESSRAAARHFLPAAGAESRPKMRKSL